MFCILAVFLLLPTHLFADPDASKSFLVISWFPGCCAVYGLKCTTTEPSWTIHGLMPEGKSDIPTLLSPATKTDAKGKDEQPFNSSLIKADPSLLSDLEKKWPSVNPRFNNEQFWKYMWEKSGVHFKQNPLMKEQNGYFRQTLTLFDGLQINEKIMKAMKPSNEEPIPLLSIIDRITELYKVDVHLRCGDKTSAKNAIFTHIYFCYDTALKLTSCKKPKKTLCTDKVLLVLSPDVKLDPVKPELVTGAKNPRTGDPIDIPLSALLAMANEATNKNRTASPSPIPTQTSPSSSTSPPIPERMTVVLPANLTPAITEELRTNLTIIVSAANESLTSLQRQFGVILAQILVARPPNEQLVRDVTEIIERLSQSKQRLTGVSGRLRNASTQLQFAEEMTILKTVGAVIEEMVTRLILIVGRIQQSVSQ